MIREKIKSEALKQGFKKADGTINVYRLAKESGLQRKQLGDYFKGVAGLSDINIEKLFKVLNIIL